MGGGGNGLAGAPVVEPKKAQLKVTCTRPYSAGYLYFRIIDAAGAQLGADLLCYNSATVPIATYAVQVWTKPCPLTTNCGHRRPSSSMPTGR